MSSAVDRNFESESTQRHHTTIQQRHHIAEDSSSPNVTREQSRDIDEFVTNSSILGVSFKLHTDTSEILPESSFAITSTQSTSTIRDLTSDPKSIDTTAAHIDDLRSSADHSVLRSNNTEVLNPEVTLEGPTLDSNPTDISSSSQQSSETSLFLEERTTPRTKYDQSSTTQVSSHAASVSTQYTEHSFISTSTLEANISEHILSTNAREKQTSVSISSKYAWKTSESGSTLHNRAVSTAKMFSESSEKPLENREPGGSPVVGSAVGATVAGLALIAVVCVLLIVYRKTRRKSFELADQDLKDYRTLMKQPKHNPTTDGLSTPYGALPYSPFAEVISEDGCSSPFSAANFRARFDYEPNETSNKRFESPTDIALEDLGEPYSSGYSEAYSVNTFRPNAQNTTEIQSENTNEV